MFKDKTIKKFFIQNEVEAIAIKDITEKNVFDTYVLPKLYVTPRFYMGGVIHSKVIGNCPHEARKDQTLSLRFRDKILPQDFCSAHARSQLQRTELKLNSGRK